MFLSRRAFLASTLLPAFAHAAPPLARKVSGEPHTWFGYYDKQPWNKSGAYHIAHRVEFIDRQPKAGDMLTVGVIDAEDKFIALDRTEAWSWQQAAATQWLPTDAENSLVYNTLHDGQYVATVRNVMTGKVRTLPRPIYNISPDGSIAITTDFSRTHRLRPGYGYATIPDRSADVAAPKDNGIWTMDVSTGKSDLVVTIAQLAAFQPDDRFRDAHHGVEHLNFSPTGKRVVFLHRWKKQDLAGFNSRMLTMNPDGSDLRILHDSGQISHFDWKDDTSLLAWVRVKRNEPKLAFMLLDIDAPPQVVFEKIVQDGHCSYSPDRQWVLNDTYPDKERLQHLMLLNVRTNERVDLGSYVSPKIYSGPWRCDLHPRWSRDGSKISFDSTADGKRGIYVMNVKSLVG